MHAPLSHLDALWPQAQGDPRAMIALARHFIAADDRQRGLAIARDVHAMTGGAGEAGVIAAEMLSDGVFSWHFLIPRDRARNDAYEQALARAIRPNSRVLEIGAGSGLLAMMAARLGAEVVTCEADPAIAAAARDVVAANGLSDRVRVVHAHSTALDAARDLGWQADILVSEIVSNDLLSEAVLPAHEDAVARLLAPGGVVIPARGTIRIALARDVQDFGMRLGQVSGFDLSPFNRLIDPTEMVGAGREQIMLASEPADLFGFDFGSGGPWTGERAEVQLASDGGRIDGVVQWIALDMDGTGAYENRPAPGAASCWSPVLWRFPAPVEVPAGTKVTIGGAHERDRLRLWQQ